MSAVRLPVQFNPIRYAEQRRLITGEMPLRGMSRLAELLLDSSESVRVTLQCDIDSDGYRIVSGELATTLQLSCQRCLEPVRLPLQLTIALAAVMDERAAEQLPSHYEPLLLSADGSCFLRDLIEDELLLALPVITRHPEGACPVKVVPPVVASEAVSAAHPFAALAALKKN